MDSWVCSFLGSGRACLGVARCLLSILGPVLGRGGLVRGPILGGGGGINDPLVTVDTLLDLFANGS